MKNKVFFSYASRDKNKYEVHKIIEAVKNKLIADYNYSDNDYFYDSSNLKGGGEEIKKTLKKSIENCDYFFRFTSKNYKDFAWCTFESGATSLHNDILIIDIIIEDGYLNNSKKTFIFYLVMKCSLIKWSKEWLLIKVSFLDHFSTNTFSFFWCFTCIAL